jgi:hypothetical protein
MAKRTIYLDTYHEIMVKNVALIMPVSVLTSKALDEWIYRNYLTLDSAIQHKIVRELAIKMRTDDFSFIPLYTLRKAVETWHRENPPTMKSKLQRSS